MIANSFERLQTNREATEWWQTVLDNPHFVAVMDGARVLAQQNPPVPPPGASPIETFALAQAAMQGASAALSNLDQLGSKAISLLRAANENQRQSDERFSPARAGRGYGEIAEPPFVRCLMSDVYEIPHRYLDLMQRSEWGPIMWKQLHDRPAETEGDLNGEPEWIDQFRRAIPCDDCRLEFTNYLQHNPVDFRTVNTYFRWTWGAHNFVNQRRGIPLVPWQECWGDEPKD